MGSRQSTQAKISQTPRAAGGGHAGGAAGEGRAAAAGSAAVRGSRTALWPLLAALVLLAAVLPHLRSLQYGFVWDDKFMIGPQIDLTGPADLGRLWNTPFDAPPPQPVPPNPFLRPVTLLSLALDRAIYASNPAGFHL